MKCGNCGVEVVEQSVFCHKCGQRIGQGAKALSPQSGGSVATSDSDTVVWEGNYSPKALYGVCLACLAISLALVIGGFLFFAPAWPLAVLAAVLVWLWPLGLLGYRKLAVHYRLTPQRFIHERGVLKRVTDRIEVIDMDDISFEQGILERLLGVGTLKITSSDRTHPKLVLPGIDDVGRVATVFDDARRAERNRRGVYIESV